MKLGLGFYIFQHDAVSGPSVMTERLQIRMAQLSACTIKYINKLYVLWVYMVTHGSLEMRHVQFM